MVKRKSGSRSEAIQSTSPVIWQRTAIKDLFAQAMKVLALLWLVALFLPASGRNVYFFAGIPPLIAAIVVRVLQISYPGRFTFVAFRENAITWYESLERHQRFYINILVFMVFLGYTNVLGETYIFPPVAQVFVLYCFGVAAYDIIRIYRVLSNTLPGKGLIAIGFAMGSNLAFSFAGIVIGEMTHVAPSTFPWKFRRC